MQKWIIFPVSMVRTAHFLFKEVTEIIRLEKTQAERNFFYAGKLQVAAGRYK